jgi:hypothetical protein
MTEVKYVTAGKPDESLCFEFRERFPAPDAMPCFVLSGLRRFRGRYTDEGHLGAIKRRRCCGDGRGGYIDMIVVLVDDVESYTLALAGS